LKIANYGMDRTDFLYNIYIRIFPLTRLLNKPKIIKISKDLTTLLRHEIRLLISELHK